MIRILIILALLISPACAGELSIEALPARLGCPVVVRFTKDQMAQYLRAKGVSEARIVGLSKCLS